jgi:hypothetical protein
VPPNEQSTNVKWAGRVPCSAMDMLLGGKGKEEARGKRMTRG